MIKNKRGVTLVELLVTITIMTIISVPIFLLLNSTTKLHQETSIDNQLQHEARFISQYMSEKIRDGAVFIVEANGWQLQKDSNVLFSYDSVAKEIYLADTTNSISSHVENFTVIAESVNNNPIKYNISLILMHQDRTYQLNTTIYRNPNSRYLN